MSPYSYMSQKEYLKFIRYENCLSVQYELTTDVAH